LQDKAKYMRENVPKEAAFKYPAAKPYKCLFLPYVYHTIELSS